jgi:hypothetical protein
MERRVTTTVRMPEQMLDEIRRIAQEEERPLNTQLLRFLRAGLERYRAEHPETRRSETRSE